MDTPERRLAPAVHALLVALPVVAALLAVACGSGGDGGRADANGERDGPSTGAPTTTAPVEDVELVAGDFINIHDMTPVRDFFVDNLLGDLDATLAVANDPAGGTYPVGTLIQLVPQEAMVKRAPGFSPETNDWEFLQLEVTEQGTTIVARGGDEVVNRFGGSCAACHQAAEPQFDLVCEDDHGCEPLPIGEDAIRAVQAADPRPRSGASPTGGPQGR